MTSTANTIPIFITVQLPLEQYKMAVGVSRVFGCESFDEYVSELIVRDLQTLRDGGEQLADWIKSIMPEDEKQGT